MYLIFSSIAALLLWGCAPSQPTAEELAAREAKAQEYAATIQRAEYLAATYDYLAAVDLLQKADTTQADSLIQSRIAQYKKAWDDCVVVKPEEITHIFYHSLVVDTKRAFDQRNSASTGYKQWMTTVVEFNRITQAMYDNGYVLIRLRDAVVETKDAKGVSHFKANPDFRLPQGKKAVVLSLDDICYYHSYDGRGLATKLVLDADGKPTCEYIQPDGTVVTGAYDSVPLLNEFCEKHPDACYHGARGMIALTGYNGILGYRTANAYKGQGNIRADQKAWLKAHPDFDWDKEREECKKVADAIKASGWEFANHTYGHIHIGDVTPGRVAGDSQAFEKEVIPLIGNTDTIIFAYGQDIGTGDPYASGSEKYRILKSYGYNFFCTVDSVPHTLRIKDGYVRQGRRNLDGYRLWNDVHGSRNRTKDLFDARKILDERRTDVPAL